MIKAKPSNGALPDVYPVMIEVPNMDWEGKPSITQHHVLRAEAEALRDQLDALLSDPAEPTAEEMLAAALDLLTGDGENAECHFEQLKCDGESGCPAEDADNPVAEYRICWAKLVQRKAIARREAAG